MPTITLTDIAVRALTPPQKGQVTYWCKSTSGFGCRVSQGGTKSWVLVHGANRQRTTLGRFPVVSLKDARKEAKRVLAEITLGKTRPISITFDEARDRFLEACETKNKPRTVYDYTRILNRHFKFGKVALSAITQHELMRRINKLSNTPSEQNHAFVTAKVFFQWCKKHNYIEGSPLADLSPPAKTHARERVLSPREHAEVFTKSLAFPYPFGPIVSLLVLTGLRRGEVASLKRDWIDTDEQIITIPNTDTKNKRTHSFPCGEKVAKILKTLPQTDEYLFPASRSHVRGKPTTHFNGWTKGKPQFDATLEGVEHYRLHDLRRTFDSTLASLGVPLHVTDRLLNHVGAISGVRATYNRYSYMSEMREAVSAFEEHLDSICNL